MEWRLKLNAPSRVGIADHRRLTIVTRGGALDNATAASYGSAAMAGTERAFARRVAGLPAPWRLLGLQAMPARPITPVLWQVASKSAKLSRSADPPDRGVPTPPDLGFSLTNNIVPRTGPRVAGVGMPAVETRASVESLGNLERRMTFRLPAERLETQVGGRLREIGRTRADQGLPSGQGARQGHRAALRAAGPGEVLDGLLRQGFDEAVRENELRLAGSPRIEPSPARRATANWRISPRSRSCPISATSTYPSSRSCGIPRKSPTRTSIA